jgi:hypothetical protein
MLETGRFFVPRTFKKGLDRTAEAEGSTPFRSTFPISFSIRRCRASAVNLPVLASEEDYLAPIKPYSSLAQINTPRSLHHARISAGNHNHVPDFERLVDGRHD